MTEREARDILHEELPFLPEEAVGFFLWNCTGWPCFFVGDPETCSPAVWGFTCGRWSPGGRGQVVSESAGSPVGAGRGRAR
jgi:hypothetical protein